MKQVFYLLIPLLILIGTSCEKEDPINPFEDQQVNQDTVELEIIDPEPASIAGIYANIFKPTCSNVGCHDGTFEPDFRSMESAFNTLVYQTPIKNDGNYSYRVHPYNVDSSVIMGRLNDLLSPRMPIQVEPDSDWPSKKAEYIDHIRTWIANGAPDITGQVRTKNYPAPILLGAGATIQGNWVRRIGGTGPLAIPDSTGAAYLYFAFEHEHLQAGELGFNKIAFSDNPNNFDSVQLKTLEIIPTPFQERGFYGENVEYTHRLEIDPVIEFSIEQEQWYFRVYVQDDQNPVTEIPTKEGIYYVKSYMSFRWGE